MNAHRDLAAIKKIVWGLLTKSSVPVSMVLNTAFPEDKPVVLETSVGFRGETLQVTGVARATGTGYTHGLVMAGEEVAFWFQPPRSLASGDSITLEMELTLV